MSALARLSVIGILVLASWAVGLAGLWAVIAFPDLAVLLWIMLYIGAVVYVGVKWIVR